MAKPHRSAGPLRVLMVAYYFPPVATSASMRPLAFCRYLPRDEYSLSVLAADPDSVRPALEIDPLLTTRLPAHIPVHRISHAHPLDRAVEWRDYLVHAAWRGAPRGEQDAAPVATVNGHRTSGSWARFKDVALYRLFEFPDRQRFWYRPAVRRGLQLGPGEAPQVVFATGGPWTSLLVGQRLARHYGVPLVVDFRDPWTRNPFKSPAAMALAERAAALERAVCESASYVVANTDELRLQFESDYPRLAGRVVTITNGFDDEPVGVSNLAEAQRNGRPFTIGHFGTVYGPRNPRSLLLALQSLLDEGLSAQRVQVRFVGRWEMYDRQTNEIADALEARGAIARVASVPYDECQRQMREVDALLILQPGAPLQIPGKIYECVAAGRPLLALTDEGATAALIRRSRLGTCCVDEPGALRKLLAAIASGRHLLEVPAQSDIERFSYRSLTRQLSGILGEVGRRHAYERRH